jgi:hypothetical protein
MLFSDYGILSAIYVRILKLQTSFHHIMYGKAQNLFTVQLSISGTGKAGTGGTASITVENMLH